MKPLVNMCIKLAYTHGLSVTPKDIKQYTPPIKEKSCDKKHMEEKQTHRHRKQTCGENMIVQE